MMTNPAPSSHACAESIPRARGEAMPEAIVRTAITCRNSSQRCHEDKGLLGSVVVVGMIAASVIVVLLNHAGERKGARVNGRYPSTVSTAAQLRPSLPLSARVDLAQVGNHPSV